MWLLEELELRGQVAPFVVQREIVVEPVPFVPLEYSHLVSLVRQFVWIGELRSFWVVYTEARPFAQVVTQHGDEALGCPHESVGIRLVEEPTSLVKAALR